MKTTLLGQAVVAVSAATVGAGLTWFLTQPTNEIVEYSITSTSLRADPSLQGLIPEIKIQIGDEEVPELNVHTVQIGCVPGSYVEEATLAVDFAVPARTYGQIVAQAPSSAHEIMCHALHDSTPARSPALASSQSPATKKDRGKPTGKLVRGLRCDLKPLSGGDQYTIVVASSSSQQPSLTMPADRVVLRRSGGELPRDTLDRTYVLGMLIITIIIALTCAVYIISRAMKDPGV